MAYKRNDAIQVLRDKIKHTENLLIRLKENLDEIETKNMAVWLSDDYYHRLISGYTIIIPEVDEQ